MASPSSSDVSSTATVPAMIGMRGHELLQRHDEGGHAALHVGRAAAVQQAVADRRLERIAAPVLRAVRSAPRRCGRGTPAPATPLPCVAQRFFTGAERACARSAKPARCEPSGDQRLATGVVRRDRSAGDQVHGQRQHVAHALPIPKRFLKPLSVKPDADRAVHRDHHRPLDQRRIFLEQQRPLGVGARRLARSRQRCARSSMHC